MSKNEIAEMKSHAPFIGREQALDDIAYLLCHACPPDACLEIRVLSEYFQAPKDDMPGAFRVRPEAHFSHQKEWIQHAEVLLDWNQRPGTNIYFAINPRKHFFADNDGFKAVEADKKKPKFHVASVGWLHLDLDGIMPKEARKIADELSLELIWVCSGAGSHGYLLLKEAVTINSTEDAQVVEAYVRRLMLAFGQKAGGRGADATHDISRILRVPGLINWPEHRKRQKGRVPSACFLAHRTEHRYSLQDLDALLPPLTDLQPIDFEEAVADGPGTGATDGHVDQPTQVFRSAFQTKDTTKGLPEEMAKKFLKKTAREERFRRLEAYLNGMIRDQYDGDASRFWTGQSPRGSRARWLIHLGWMFGVEVNDLIQWAQLKGSPIHEPDHWDQYCERYLAPFNPMGHGLAHGIRLSPLELAVLFLHRQGYGQQGSALRLRYWRGEFYAWHRAHFERVAADELSAQITRTLQQREADRDHLTQSLVRNVVTNLQGLCHLTDVGEPPFWIESGRQTPAHSSISLTNGILDLEACLAGHAELKPHSPEFFTLASLPFDFDSEAQCPRWLSFLEEALPDPAVRDLVQEWFGYNLAFDVSQHRFAVFYGEGANGKSVVCCVLKSLLGPAGYSAVGLEAFSPTRTFPLAAMMGKLANIAEEIGEIDKAAEGVVKQVVAGGEITVERKYRDPFLMRPTARLTFSTNVLPRFTDRSNGIWRRMLLIPFKIQVAEADQDKRLTTPEFWRTSGELPGVMLWALEGLRRLRGRGHFEEPRECRLAKNQYRMDGNPALAFLSEHCVVEKGAEVSSKDLYEAYAKFVQELGQHALAAPQFAKEVHRNIPSARLTKNAVRLPGGTRGRLWRGLRLWTYGDDAADEIEDEDGRAELPEEVPAIVLEEEEFRL